MLETALNQMDPIDREVLVLRHFEHLSGRESAIVLKMGYEAVKKRYLRALEKLERILASLSNTSKIELEVDSEMLSYYQDRR
jgi:RNA polymerase sigma-70 factor (ECF subfamily)